MGLLGLLAPSDFGGELFWDGGERHLGGLAVAANACDGFVTASFPDLCPSGSREIGGRDDTVPVGRLAIDDEGQPWVAYLLVDVFDSCSWTSTGSCIETQDCSCQEQVITRANALEVVVERVGAPQAAVSVPLPTVHGRSGGIHLALRADGGTISVAVADSDRDDSEIYVMRFAPPE